jgi:hypothetical protein
MVVGAQQCLHPPAQLDIVLTMLVEKGGTLARRFSEDLGEDGFFVHDGSPDNKSPPLSPTYYQCATAVVFHQLTGLSYFFCLALILCLAAAETLRASATSRPPHGSGGDPASARHRGLVNGVSLACELHSRC